MILLIGWRGAPTIKDEAQHDIQVRFIRSLELFEIKSAILEKIKIYQKLKS